MADPYREILHVLVGLGADRVLVLQGPQPLQPRLVHGFQGHWQDQIDLSQLQKHPISSERSICIPFWSPSSRILGILYADTRKVFTRETLAAMQRCARRLEQLLYGAAPPAPKKHGQATATAGRRLGLRPASRRTEPDRRVSSSGDKSPLLRSLATMLTAGLPIDRALHSLSGQYEVCERLCQKLCAGDSLSLAMAESGAFAPFESALVEAGEQSGSLDRVLMQLAEVAEKQRHTRMRLQSALAYPLLLSALSLLALLFFPPLFLKGQLQLLPHPPLLTRLLLGGAGGPLVLALTGLSAWGLRNRYRRWQLWRLWGASRFAGCLAITYRVGVPITIGLELAARASQLPGWQADLEKAQDSLQNGERLSQVFSHFTSLPTCFCALTSAGEECGRVDATLDWVALFLQQEFENRLDSVLNLLQPLLLGAMGLWVGVLLLATMLPLVELVQSL